MRLVVATLFIFSIANLANAGTIKKDEVEYQDQNFEHWWGGKLEWNLSELPTKGAVEDYRVPYSGHDYPDKGGGTIRAMIKYDRAFNDGLAAAAWEKEDVGDRRRLRSLEAVADRPRRRGLFRGGLFARLRSERQPSWYGHCNGWTAAAIRHAEPTKSVVRNGVRFTPADIKGLLAEIYMYCDSEFLGGEDAVINPGLMHVVLSNWLGRGNYPLGMESAVGEVVINYPIYKYESKLEKISDTETEVRTTVTYRMNTGREFDSGPDYSRTMVFHYIVETTADGVIKGGRYYRDSANIDMLWSPLKPRNAGEEGNERGNPHVDVDNILAIWRESVSEDIRKKWLNIDPTPADAIVDEEEEESDATAADDSEAGDAAEESEPQESEPQESEPEESEPQESAIESARRRLDRGLPIR
ncbi:MAG: hypothetical protein QGG36_19615 [Pirellulaceae bacterium]|jgi:hypothetical protein|nr:hypothetical protein [Pirellulaceae bacterium]